MSIITYHENKPAVDVKDRHLYRLDPVFLRTFTNLTSDEWMVVYDSVREDFWQFLAPHIAERYDYGEVYSEGRSDGWLVVENPPDSLDPCPDCDGSGIRSGVGGGSRLNQRIADNELESAETILWAERDVVTIER